MKKSDHRHRRLLRSYREREWKAISFHARLRPGELEVVDRPPEGGKVPEMEGTYAAFAPDYAPEEMFEVATKLYKKLR